MIGNELLFNAPSARISSVESTVSARMNSIESRMLSLEGKMDLLIGKVADMDTRLSILEDRTERG
jgi:predicted nuclease with TOPRIM domain